tara:strand:- start:867 stop:1154 length:288 start_codon:yes stop_codon:yes gene_type:complete
MLPSNDTFMEYAKDYHTSYDEPNDDNMFEYVDGIVPHTYFEISEQFNDMHLEIEQYQVGMPIWKVMQINLFEQYYQTFKEIYEEYVEMFEGSTDE